MRPQLVEWQSWRLPAEIKERGLVKDLSSRSGFGARVGYFYVSRVTRQVRLDAFFPKHVFGRPCGRVTHIG
jgi:hypothetical protein